MAYPTVQAPYGLKPINLIGGQVFAGSTTELPIQYGYASNIFYGDLVNIVKGGIVKNTDTTDSTGNGLVGVFLGCAYTNPSNKQRQYAQYWPAGTAAGDGVAYVSVDPDAVFKVVMCSSSSVIASAATSMIGQNFALIQNAGNVNTGNSAVAALYNATSTSSDYALRVVGMVPETAVTQSATGSSSSTAITLTGSGLPGAIVVGTEVGYIASNGQYVQTGSYVATAAAAGALSVTMNLAIDVPGSVTAIPGGSTIVFTQYPEMLVKLNFGTHQYYTGTAITQS
jgi:hypothetical protein